MRFQDQEDDVLLARARDAFLDAERLGHRQQHVRRLALQFVEIDHDARVRALDLGEFFFDVAAILVAAVLMRLAAVAIAAARAATVVALRARTVVLACVRRGFVAGGVRRIFAVIARRFRARIFFGFGFGHGQTSSAPFGCYAGGGS